MDLFGEGTNLDHYNLCLPNGSPSLTQFGKNLEKQKKILKHYKTRQKNTTNQNVNYDK